MHTHPFVLVQKIPAPPNTASTLRGAASDMCQSDLFTLVNCLKALQLDAVHPSWQRESMIRCALFMLLQKTRSSNKKNTAHKLLNEAVLGSMRWMVVAKVQIC